MRYQWTQLNSLTCRNVICNRVLVHVLLLKVEPWVSQRAQCSSARLLTSCSSSPLTFNWSERQCDASAQTESSLSASLSTRSPTQTNNLPVLFISIVSYDYIIVHPGHKDLLLATVCDEVKKLCVETLYFLLLLGRSTLTNIHCPFIYHRLVMTGCSAWRH